MASNESAVLPAGMLRVTFHANLSVAHPGAEHRVRAHGRTYRLVPHTPQTLAAAQAAEPSLAKFPQHIPTHFTDEPIPLSPASVRRVYVEYTQTGTPWNYAILSVSIFCPPVGDELAEVQRKGATIHRRTDWISTAQALIFHHPDLINQCPNTTSIINSYYDDDNLSNELNNLASSMANLGLPSQPGQSGGWAIEEGFTPAADPETGITGKPNFVLQPRACVQKQAATVMSLVMIAAKNDLRLRGKKWTAQSGKAVETATPPAGSVPPARQEGPAEPRPTAANGVSLALANTNPIHGLLSEISVNPANQQLTLTLTNTYVRYLSAFIGFLDADGNPIIPPTNSSGELMWENYGDLSSEAKIVNSMLPVPGLCYLGHIQPILTVYGIPVYARPGQLTVTITSFPANAVTMLIYGSGLGTGANPYKNQPLVGGMLTGLFNLGVPALMLAVGTVNQFSETLQGIIEDAFEKNWVKILTGIGAVAITIESIVTGVYCHSNWQTLESIGEFLFQIVWSEVMAYMAFLDAEEEIEDQIPFLGWCMVAINIAAGIAQITETIVEVAESPWNIENHVSITITTTVNHHPDPRSGVFPAPRPNLASTYQAKMIFQNEQRPTVMVKGTVPSDFTGSTLQLQFPNNTLGGTVKFEAEYYIGEWIAAKATSAWMANNAEKTAAVDLTFIDIPIPLTAGSSYAHAQLLTYDNGSYGWTETGVPPSTTRTSIPSNPNNQIWQWNSLALSQRNQSLGSAWSAAGMGITECGSQGSGILYAMQNVKIPGEQSINAVFPSCGFSQPTVLLYDSYPPKFGMIYDLDSKMWTWALGPNGQLVPDPDSPSLGSFYLDPRKTNNPLDQDGGAHLRQVSGGADTTPFNMAADQLSWGRFPVVPDAMVLHPSGNIVGINTEYGKIFVLKGAPAGVSDDQALMARAYAGQATNAERPGLTFRPVGVCCSSDGTIFVLENGTAGSAVIARVQAFDLHSNPVSCFYDSGGQPTPFLNLSNAGPLTFIDVACVGDHTMTYLFVIAYASDGNEVSQYQVAVYQVASDPPSNPQPLFTASGVPAARLAVDMWHSMYTLNYGMTTNSEGQPAGPDGAGTGPAGRTVPSVSRWLPSN